MNGSPNSVVNKNTITIDMNQTAGNRPTQSQASNQPEIDKFKFLRKLNHNSFELREIKCDIRQYRLSNLTEKNLFFLIIDEIRPPNSNYEKKILF